MSPKITVTPIPPPTDTRIIPVPAGGPTLQPRTWDTKKVQVLRIPADGSPNVSINFDTTESCSHDTENCIHDEETKTNEPWARHVPNIRDFGKGVFDWKSRSLVAAKIDGTLVPEESGGWWFMYKCNKAWGGLSLKKNPFFEQDKGAQAFGDVFVFRAKFECDQWGRRIYEKGWSVPKGEVGREILVSMAKR